MKNDNIKLHNLLLPLWILVFLPTWLWLVLIPLNYMIDRVVLKWSLGGIPDKGLFCKKHTWKICLAGFLSDFAGALLLLVTALPLTEEGGDTGYKIGNAIIFDPFSNAAALLIVVASIAIAAVCIYFLDKWILGKTGLDPEQVKRSAVRLALITAPYLYLLPSRLIYK